jgi:hypothetical protein
MLAMNQTKAAPERVGEDDLEAAVERFAKWRQARQRGAHIPTELWASAVSLSTRHGTHCVAEALGLNADRLLRRVRVGDDQAAPTKAADPVPDSTADFVQMLVAAPEDETGAAPALAPTAAQPCVLELRNARGATLRLELPAQALAILPGLCAAFGGA